MSENAYPIYLKPSYQQYIWGGRKLADVYNRKLPEGIVAESWEVSDREEGMGVVQNGAATGKTLAELVDEMGADLLGSKAEPGKFPLLIKILDAQKVLSVQVHPNDETMKQYGGEAKTEMWYLLHADEGAQVYCGLKEGVTREVYEAAVEQGGIPELLETIAVKRGDAIFVPGGRVHAIDAGCLILEVQQNSNTTYRIDDFGRMGADGKPRELHTEKALEVITFGDTEHAGVEPVSISATDQTELLEICRSPYFLMEKWVSQGEARQEIVSPDGSSFHVLFMAKGSGVVSANGEAVIMREGMSVLIPACTKTYEVNFATAGAEIIRITLPA